MSASFRLAFIIASLLSYVHPALAAPARVVSLNLCADQLLLALADPGQIAGLGPFSRDPGISAAAAQAVSFPRIGRSAEAILMQKSDLVLAGPYDRPVASGALDRSGVAVKIVDVWQGFEKGKADIVALGETLGQPERAEALVAALEAARGRLAGRGRGRMALALGHGGYMEGKSGILGMLIAASGLRDMAQASSGRFVSMESLLLLQPDVLVLSEGEDDANDRGAAFLLHPAMRSWIRERKVIRLPPHLTACAGPALVEAMDRLGHALQD